MSEQTGTDVATLPPADRAALALGSSKAEIQLREIVAESADITAVIDMAGREQAHRAGMKLKNARTSIEKTGKLAREDAQAFSKAVIAEEARLTGIITDEENRVFALRDAFDAKCAAEKAEKDRIEKERVDRIKQMIASISALPMALHGESAIEIETELNALVTMEPGEEFAEFVDEAKEVVAAVIESLTVMLERVKLMEAESARLAAERAELERLQAEAAERARVAAEQQAAIDAQNKAAAEAESARITQEREQLEADKRAFQEQQAAAKRDDDERAEEESTVYLTPAERAALQGEVNAHSAAMLDAVSTGLGMVKIVANDDGLEATHISLSDVINSAFPDPEHPVAQAFAEVPANQAVRDIAIHTAEQFAALATKVMAIGIPSYANELANVAARIQSGGFDDLIAKADWTALAGADDILTMASVNCRMADERAA